MFIPRSMLLMPSRPEDEREKNDYRAGHGVAVIESWDCLAANPPPRSPDRVASPLCPQHPLDRGLDVNLGAIENRQTRRRRFAQN